MPVYEYLCDSHGAFTAMRPMSEYLDPQSCPDCGMPAPRVMLSVPHLSSMSSGRMAAYAKNELSRHAPLTAGDYRDRHSPGCSCCSGGLRPLSENKGSLSRSAKGFANKRPWMISH